MNACDGAGLPFPALFPTPETTQTIVLAADTNTARVAADFKPDTVAIGVRVRGNGVAAVRLGGGAVTATIADLSIAKEDLWVFLSVDGIDENGVRMKASRLGAYAKGAAVTLEICEFN